MREGHVDEVTAALADSAREEIAGLAELDVATLWHGTVDAFGEYLDERADPRPWPGIAARIERALEDRRGVSHIRLGDGEGNLLAPVLGEYPALAEYCARRTSIRHFGVPDVLARGAPELIPAFAEALRNADLIGFPEPFGTAFLRERCTKNRFATESFWRPVQGLVCTQLYLTRFADELNLGAKRGSFQNFNLELLPHYKQLISGRRIGALSCHQDLADALRTGMGAAAVDLRLVPGQAVLAEDPEADTGYWPARHHELLSELQSIEPGMLWMVAAGLPGKIYCEVIRKAGGVAVDIGHVADIWLGLRTRFTTGRRLLDAWRLT